MTEVAAPGEALVERVSRAMVAAVGDDPDRYWPEMVVEARAAITSLLTTEEEEVTEEMREGGDAVVKQQAWGLWESMDREAGLEFVEDIYLAMRSARQSIPGEGVTDKQRLDWLQEECADVRWTELPTGGGDADVGCQIVGHYMAEPQERVLAEVFEQDVRKAVDAARKAVAEKGAYSSDFRSASVPVRSLEGGEVAAAYERAAKVADYGVERAERDWRNPDKQEAVREVSREIAEVIRQYKADALQHSTTSQAPVAEEVERLREALLKSEKARSDCDFLHDALGRNLGEQLDKAGAPRFGTLPEHGLPHRLASLIAALQQGGSQ